MGFVGLAKESRVGVALERGGVRVVVAVGYVVR